MIDQSTIYNFDNVLYIFAVISAVVIGIVIIILIIGVVIISVAETIVNYRKDNKIDLKQKKKEEVLIHEKHISCIEWGEADIHELKIDFSIYEADIILTMATKEIYVLYIRWQSDKAIIILYSDDEYVNKNRYDCKIKPSFNYVQSLERGYSKNEFVSMITNEFINKTNNKICFDCSLNDIQRFLPKTKEDNKE